MKKKIKYISLVFLLIWIIGVIFRIWDHNTNVGFGLKTYSTFDAITDASLILGIVGIIAGAFIKDPSDEEIK